MNSFERSSHHPWTTAHLHHTQHHAAAPSPATGPTWHHFAGWWGDPPQPAPCRAAVHGIGAGQACSDTCTLHVVPVQRPHLRGRERATFMRRGSDTKPSLSVRTTENITTSASRPCMSTTFCAKLPGLAATAQVSWPLGWGLAKGDKATEAPPCAPPLMYHNMVPQWLLGHCMTKQQLAGCCPTHAIAQNGPYSLAMLRLCRFICRHREGGCKMHAYSAALPKPSCASHPVLDSEAH